MLDCYWAELSDEHKRIISDVAFVHSVSKDRVLQCVIDHTYIYRPFRTTTIGFIQNIIELIWTEKSIDKN